MVWVYGMGIRLRAQGGCKRSNLILFVLVLVLVLVNQNFIGDEHEDEYEDEGGSCRAVAQRAKAAHLNSVICLLYSDT
jgi:hypothetical protein